jgi:putative transposase
MRLIFSARRLIELREERDARRLLERMEFTFKARRSDRSYQLWQEGDPIRNAPRGRQ